MVARRQSSEAAQGREARGSSAARRYAEALVVAAAVVGLSWSLRDELGGARLFVYIGVSAILGHAVGRRREARRRLAQAADGMIDAMLVFDAEWRLVLVNAAGATMLHRLGIDANALKGRVAWEVVPEVIGTTFATEARRAQTERRIVEFEELYPAADIWLQVRC